MELFKSIIHHASFSSWDFLDAIAWRLWLPLNLIKYCLHCHEWLPPDPSVLIWFWKLEWKIWRQPWKTTGNTIKKHHLESWQHSLGRKATTLFFQRRLRENFRHRLPGGYANRELWRHLCCRWWTMWFCTFETGQRLDDIKNLDTVKARGQVLLNRNSVVLVIVIHRKEWLKDELGVLGIGFPSQTLLGSRHRPSK